MRNVIEYLKLRLNPGARLSCDIAKMMRAYSTGCKVRYCYYREVIYRRYNCCISPSAEIHENVTFPHPVGIVIGDGVVIESGCTIYQHVTLGRSNKDVPLYPVIKKGCVLYAGCTVVGDVSLQPGTVVAANAVVVKSNSMKGDILMGVPARSKFEIGGGLNSHNGILSQLLIAGVAA